MPTIRHEINLATDHPNRMTTFTAQAKYACFLTPEIYQPAGTKTWTLEVSTTTAQTVTLVGEDNTTYATINTTAGGNHTQTFVPSTTPQPYYLKTSSGSVVYNYARIILIHEFTGALISQEIQIELGDFYKSGPLESSGFVSFPSQKFFDIDGDKWSGETQIYLECFFSKSTADYSDVTLVREYSPPWWTDTDYSCVAYKSGDIYRVTSSVIPEYYNSVVTSVPYVGADGASEAIIHNTRLIIRQSSGVASSLPSETTVHSWANPSATYSSVQYLYAGYRTFCGASIIPSQSFKLKSFKVQIRRVGSPTGNVYCHVFGGYNSDINTKAIINANTGTHYVAQAVSAPIAVDTISTSAPTASTGFVTFDFTNSDFICAENMAYIFVVFYDGGDSTNRIQLYTESYVNHGDRVYGRIAQDTTVSTNFHVATSTSLAAYSVTGYPLTTLACHNFLNYTSSLRAVISRYDSLTRAIVMGKFKSTKNKPYLLKTIALKMAVEDTSGTLISKCHIKVPQRLVITAGNDDYTVQQTLATSTNSLAYDNSQSRGTFNYDFGDSGFTIYPGIEYCFYIEIDPSYSHATNRHLIYIYSAADGVTTECQRLREANENNVYFDVANPTYIAEYSVVGVELAPMDNMKFQETYTILPTAYPDGNISHLQQTFNPSHWNGVYNIYELQQDSDEQDLTSASQITLPGQGPIAVVGDQNQYSRYLPMPTSTTTLTAETVINPAKIFSLKILVSSMVINGGYTLKPLLAKAGLAQVINKIKALSKNLQISTKASSAITRGTKAMLSSISKISSGNIRRATRRLVSAIVRGIPKVGRATKRTVTGRVVAGASFITKAKKMIVVAARVTGFKFIKHARVFTTKLNTIGHNLPILLRTPYLKTLSTGNKVLTAMDKKILKTFLKKISSAGTIKRSTRKFMAFGARVISSSMRKTRITLSIKSGLIPARIIRASRNVLKAISNMSGTVGRSNYFRKALAAVSRSCVAIRRRVWRSLYTTAKAIPKATRKIRIALDAAAKAAGKATRKAKLLLVTMTKAIGNVIAANYYRKALLAISRSSGTIRKSAKKIINGITGAISSFSIKIKLTGIIGPTRAIIVYENTKATIEDTLTVCKLIEDTKTKAVIK